MIIDFLAERLGLPYLSAYLDSVGSNFSHGANFAASGSTIKLIPGLNPVHLHIQLSQFEQSKSRSIDLYNQEQSSCAKMRLPAPDDFSNALYTLDTGQNDLFHGLASETEEQVQSSIPGIIDVFALALERLYQQGARAFWIHNTGPIGCLAYFKANRPPKPSNADKVGCVKSYNKVAQEFNKQLKDKVSQIRIRFQDASLIYIDIYSAKYSLISEAKAHGFVNPLGYCCGRYEGYRLECGEKALVNGTEVFGAPCNNPSEYISWDKLHYTEAANHWVADRILDGSLLDPPQIPVTQACHKSLHSQ